MKRLLGMLALCSAVLAGCNNKSEELEKQVADLKIESATLQQNLAERDKYFDDVLTAVNEVYSELEQTRAREAEVLQRAAGAEGAPQYTSSETRQKLLGRITTIGTTLKENRQKLAALQAKVKQYGAQFSSLNDLIMTLKTSLQEREKSIAQLEARVQGLESTVAEKVQVIRARDVVIDEQQKALNTVYFVAGTRKELEQKGIIASEGGFLWGLLGSTSVLASGVDESLFTPMDKTADQTIRVGGTIKELLPRRNEELYSTNLADEASTELRVADPKKFWQDRYLVVVLD